MSSSPAIAHTASSAASANPFSSLGTQDTNGGLAGLFLNFLSMGQQAAKASAEGGLSATTNGNKAVKFEQKLLVIPQGLANLSEADLKNLLASTSATADGEIGNSLLLALTPGTPAAQAIADFLAQLRQDGRIEQVSTLSALGNASALTTSSTDASTAGNILLVATGLAPQDMEHLKDMLSSQDDSTANDIALKLDGTDATDTTAIALVMFIPPAFQNSFKPLTDNGTDILLPINITPSNLSALTDENASASNGLHLGKYISPFMSNGNSKFSESADVDTGEQSADADFSLTTTNPHHAHDDKLASKIEGKLDNKAAGIGLNGFQTWKHDSEFFAASPLTANNNVALTAGSAPLINPLVNNPSAAGTHPAVQTVAAMIERAAGAGSEKAKQELSIQLDPPELGRVQVHLSYEKGESMKVHLTTEKQETLTLLQRDAHALKSALEQAGVQTDGSSLSFDMAGGDQSFNQLLGQGREGQHSRNHVNFSINSVGDMVSDFSEPIETRMDFVTDSVTGNVHYSLLV